MNNWDWSTILNWTVAMGLCLTVLGLAWRNLKRTETSNLKPGETVERDDDKLL